MEKVMTVFDGENSYFYKGENPPSEGMVIEVEGYPMIVESLDDRQQELVIHVRHINNKDKVSTYSCEADVLPFKGGMFSYYNNAYIALTDRFKSALISILIDECHNYPDKDFDWKDGLEAHPNMEEIIKKASVFVNKQLDDEFAVNFQ